MPVKIPTKIPKRSGRKGKHYPAEGKIDVAQAVDLKYNHHLSYLEIAKIQGVSPQGIHNRIKDLLPIPETQIYINHRADILAHNQLRMLQQLDSPRLKKMQARDAVVSMGILYDKERIERGLSTANLNMLMADIEAIRGKDKDVSTGKLPE